MSELRILEFNVEFDDSDLDLIYQILDTCSEDASSFSNPVTCFFSYLRGNPREILEFLSSSSLLDISPSEHLIIVCLLGVLLGDALSS